MEKFIVKFEEYHPNIGKDKLKSQVLNYLHFFLYSETILNKKEKESPSHSHSSPSDFKNNFDDILKEISTSPKIQNLIKKNLNENNLDINDESKKAIFGNEIENSFLYEEGETENYEMSLRRNISCFNQITTENINFNSLNELSNSTKPNGFRLVRKYFNLNSEVEIASKKIKESIKKKVVDRFTQRIEKLKLKEFESKSRKIVLLNKESNLAKLSNSIEKGKGNKNSVMQSKNSVSSFDYNNHSKEKTQYDFPLLEPCYSSFKTNKVKKENFKISDNCYIKCFATINIEFSKSSLLSQVFPNHENFNKM